MRDTIEYLKEYIILLLKANLDKKNIIEEKARKCKAKKEIVVVQRDISSFNIINIFDSLSQASKTTKINVGNIHNSLDKFKKNGNKRKRKFCNKK